LDKKEIARRLVEARGQRSQQEVADAIGISRSALAMYELGLRIPRDEIKMKLAQLYEIPIQDLFYSGACHE